MLQRRPPMLLRNFFSVTNGHATEADAHNTEADAHATEADAHATEADAHATEWTEAASRATEGPHRTVLHNYLSKSLRLFYKSFALKRLK